MTSNNPRSFAVIGLGAFGKTVAIELERFGNYVLGIDLDSGVVNQMADELSQAVVADAREEDAMKELGLGNYDVALIAIGGDLESSIISVITAKMAGVKTVWAKSSNKMHHRILSKVGVDRIINPEVEMGQHIAQMLHNPLVRDYLSLGNGYHVVNIVVPEWLAGKDLNKLELGPKLDLHCIGVMRGSELLSLGREECELENGDLLLLLGKRNQLSEFAETVSK